MDSDPYLFSYGHVRSVLISGTYFYRKWLWILNRTRLVRVMVSVRDIVGVSVRVRATELWFPEDFRAREPSALYGNLSCPCVFILVFTTWHSKRI